MMKIKVLPDNLANKIAAGEVVERPASVVKELMENSLDAGAGRVFIDVQAGGTKLISVSDDGSGMSPDDTLLSLERHATSKITSSDDLAAITTLGFRGEALPSIASVSRLRLITSEGDGRPGTLVVIEGGKLLNVKETGAARGTIIEVRDLFFNTPARLKFLKSMETEYGHIAASVEKAALAHPEVHFRLTHGGRDTLDCPPVKRLKDRVEQVYGSVFADGIIDAGCERGTYRAYGFVTAPGVSFSNRARQELFVNGRPVKSPAVTRAVYDACQSLLMKDRHPAYILYLTMSPDAVDVNVHPTKREVRFVDNSEVHRVIYEAVTSAYKGGAPLEMPELPQTPESYSTGVREAVETYFARPHTSQPRQEAFTLPRGKPVPGQPVSAGTATHETTRDTPYHIMLLQVADSYIVMQADDGFMVVDQHAAHERIQYERVKARHNVQGGSQGLLVPVRIDLSAKEAALMEGIIPELATMGVEVEPFGGGSFLIRSRPLFLEKADIKELVLGVLADIGEQDVKGRVDDLREKVYQLMACKSAVKAGVKLHPEAMARLVRQLFECEMPYTCAHGRPTVVKFGMGELEKMFKRK